MLDRDNSKIQEDLSDIRGVSKQPQDVSTVIRMGRCETSSLELNNLRLELNKYLVSI